MTPEIIFVFALLAVTIVLFLLDKIRLDVIALMVVLVLMASEILTPAEALAGLGSPVVFIIAALFVIGEALTRTGFANFTGRFIMRHAGSQTTLLTLMLMATVAILSAFMSSTGAVAIFIPIALTLARQLKTSASEMMMPMAYAALIGGMFTLIGTPPNLIVSNELANHQGTGFGFFDFAPIGLAIFLVSSVYLLTIGRKLIPQRGSATSTVSRSIDKLIEDYNEQDHMVEFEIGAHSPFIGKSLSEVKFRRRFGLIIMAIERKSRLGVEYKPVYSNTRFAAGDILIAISEVQRLNIDGFPEQLRPVDRSKAEDIINIYGLAEVIVVPQSRLIGSSIKEYGFRDKTLLHVISHQSDLDGVNSHPLDTKIKSGDRLLIAGEWDAISKLRENQDVLLLTLPNEFENAAPQANKLGISCLILAMMLISLTLGWSSNEVILLATAFAFGITGCVSMTQAYKSINWQSLILIAGMLPMATALSKTGAMSLVVEQLSASLAAAGPYAVMTMLFVITALFSQFISNTATAVLIAPVAVGIASQLSIQPEPLLVTVAVAASAAFATPVASPVNTLMMAPGGYKFLDFCKVGIPLQLIVLGTTLFVVPLLFPL